MNPASGPPLPPPPPPQAPWQSHHIRAPWGRPPPMPREEHHALCPPNLPPTNMPPPQIRPRGNIIINYTFFIINFILLIILPLCE